MKFTPEHERTLLDCDAYSIDRANAISCMRSDGIQRHEELLVSFLDDKCAELRGESVQTLLSWDQREYLPLALDWLAAGVEPELRVHMANCLARWAVVHSADSKPIVVALVRRLEIEEDQWALYWTYHYVRRALGLTDFQAGDEDDFDRDRDIDWAMLAQYRDVAQHPIPETGGS